jgi:hypothetical protein
MASSTRAVAYYRVSTLQQTQSIPQQRGWAREVCGKEGIDLVAEFQDEGISGNKTSKRDGFKQMLAFCQKHQTIEAVVKRGRDNLLRVRDDNVFLELNRALGDLARERDAVASEVARLEVSSPDRRETDQATVEKVIERRRSLGQHLANAKPERLREVLHQMLVRVDLHYEELGADRKKRQWKRLLKGVATLKPQVGFSGNGKGVTSP